MDRGWMKKKIIFMVSILCSSATALAETIPPGEIVLPDNFLTNALQPVIQKVSLLVGGLFGIYVILTILQIYRERKKIRLLQDIRNDLDLLTKHFGVKHAHQKKGIFKKIFSFLYDDDEAKRPKK